MVRIGLQIRVNSENIAEIRTCFPDYYFYLTVKCTNCGTEQDKWYAFCESERIQKDTRNSEGSNFYLKCKECLRENTIDILDKTNATYTTEDGEKFKTIVIFDCRGCEPTAFSPRSGWIVKSADNGQIFEDIDLSEDDWVEYDTKNKQPVGVYDFQHQFVKLKAKD